MAQKYRLVKASEFGNPSDEQSHVPNTGKDNDHDAVYVREPAQSHPWRWILGIAAVVAVIIAAVWMSGVSSSLTHLNQMTTQNGRTLSQQSSALSGIQASLNGLSQQFHQMQAEMQRFFTAIMQSLNGR